eukprot:TRINITY_DN16171_c0_g1_i3.p1 TRINITY_DN16171_c0_g1~~TRINITY_DN16171_c0_g1_i3.p1  ORF type:complete len:140 (-),score=41.76 TRINITY_DN16171_c0_g1_i3:163-582(-)
MMSNRYIIMFVGCIRVMSFGFIFFFLMIRRPPRSTQGVSSAASDVYKRQVSTQSTWVCLKEELTQSCFHLFVPQLHETEIVAEEAILRWQEKAEKSSDSRIKNFLKNMKPFLEWLTTAEEESDESEEGEESDSQMKYLQ